MKREFLFGQTYHKSNLINNAIARRNYGPLEGLLQLVNLHPYRIRNSTNNGLGLRKFFYKYFTFPLLCLARRVGGTWPPE